MEAIQLPRLTAPEPASCCCGHRSADAACKCRFCTHAREVGAGKPVLKTCGSGGGAVALATVSKDLPFSVVDLSPRTPWKPPVVDLRLVSTPPEPLLEVLTPPPLLRS